MYSVEDLLISHGYKLPRNGSASSSSAPYDKRHGDCRRDTTENRPGGGAQNGYGTEGGADARKEAGAGVFRPAHPENNNDNNERNQRRKEAPGSYLGDVLPLGDSLATDSGFYDAPSLTFSEHTEERDVSYWRRRGQDFSALLDYADPRELRVSGGLWRGPGQTAEELRAERPLPRWEEGSSWAREAADSGPETLRVTGERKCQSLGTDEWRPAVGLGRQLSDSEAERWTQEQQHHRLRPAEGAIPPPAVRAKSQSLPRVLSPEDPQYADPPQTGPLPQPAAQRLNGSSVPYGRYHADWIGGGERWSQGPGQGQSQSHSGPVALLPKPRFSRPVKPPSYETHQQSRGSWETLSSEPGSRPRDRPVCFSQTAEPLRDRVVCFSQAAEPLRDRSISHSQSAEPLRERPVCYSQSTDQLRDRSLCYSQSAEPLRPEAQRPDLLSHDPAAWSGLEPPGYIPPPSYRRGPPPRGGLNYRADSAHVRWKREPVSAEMGKWFSRQTAISWSDRREDRSMVVPRKPVHPGPVITNRPGLVQYVPFDDPRIRHISGGPGGNSLTDADKIRHVSKELPCAAVLGQSTHDSAFLPAQGLCPNTDTHKTALNEHENTTRWHRGLSKGSDSVAPDQSCAKYHTAFQVRPSQQIKADRITDQQSRTDRIIEPQIRTDRIIEPQIKTDRITDQQSRTDRPTDKGSSESVSQAKIEPETVSHTKVVSEPEKPKSIKKKLSETIFCLVSIPVPTQPSGMSRDQNNNDEELLDSPTIRVPPAPPPSSSSENSNTNTLGSLPNQSLKSTSTTSTDLELQALTGTVSSGKAPRRAAHRRHSHSRPLKPNPHEELRRYSGAWPGDQYRDQETQTSPGPSKGAAPPGPPNTEAQDPPTAPASDATADGGAVVDSGAPYGYPMKGQKSLKPSSNSAFSRTGTFCKSTAPTSKPPLQPPPHPPPPPPNQPPSQPPPPPPTQPPPQSPPSGQAEEPRSDPCLAPEAFGQFLLKPVSRRPWDAIEQLESINKELQDQPGKRPSVDQNQTEKRPSADQDQPGKRPSMDQDQSGKRPSVDQCIEDLNEAYKDILELSTASNNLPNLPNCSSMQIPDRIKARLSSEPLGNPGGSLRSGLENWTGAVPGSDPEYREVKSAFSRPSTGKSVSFSKQLREEICAAPPPPLETGFRDYRAVVSQISHRRAGHCRSVKLDIPAPKETLVRDEGLTAHASSTSSTAAEVPWADRQPMQDASTLTSPPDYEHICQSLQLSRDSGAVSRGATAKPKPGSAVSTETPQPMLRTDGPSTDPELENIENERQTREEKGSSFPKVTSNRFPNNKGILCSLVPDKPMGDQDNEASSSEAHSDVPPDWRMQLSLAENLETLLTGERVNHASAEDLNNLYEVQCAEGILENESMEERAARILGIEVTTELLVSGVQGDQMAEGPEAEAREPVESKPRTGAATDSSTTTEEPEDRDQNGEQSCKGKGTEGQEQGVPEPRREFCLSGRSNRTVMLRTHQGLDPALLLEFPPDRLPLSVLAHSGRRLSLGLDWEGRGLEGERWGHGGGGARERRSLDAERRGLCGERWGLDDDRRELGRERWSLNSESQSLGIEGRVLDDGQGLGVERRGIDDEGQSFGVERWGHGQDLQDQLAASPRCSIAMEGLARMKEVDSVSRIRHLSLCSSDSQEGEEVANGGGEGGAVEVTDPLPVPQKPPNGTPEMKDECSPPPLTNEPGETQDDQLPLTE